MVVVLGFSMVESGWKMMTMKLAPPKNKAACKGGQLGGKLRDEEGKNVMAEKGFSSNAAVFSC